MSGMQPLLYEHKESRHKWMVDPGSNGVYPFNPLIVKEHGWRPYDGPLPKIDSSTGARILSEECEFETSDQIARENAEKDRVKVAKRTKAMVEAFKELPPIEFVTANGMPKLTSIEKVCGFKPTLEEREEAFKEFKSLVMTDEVEIKAQG